jgi:hypothetical protein
MSGEPSTEAGDRSSVVDGSDVTRINRAELGQRQRRQFALITAAAIAIFLTLRYLPTGTNLSHMDFRVTGRNSIEFCDPSNPQFIPVVAARSPVTMAVSVPSPLLIGHEIDGTLTLRTSSGKPIGPEDLLVVHTKRLHLMVVDPTLTDYQHVHPTPGKTRGEWAFSFSPRRTGVYRLFADFTPIATGLGLYANTDVDVGGTPDLVSRPDEVATATKPASGAEHVVERDGFRFALTTSTAMPRARQPIELTFTVTATNGGKVPMQPVMGAYAHLVAFDAERSGFAHLHPTQADPLAPPDRVRPELRFKLTIPRAGRYVIWAQINLGGREQFLPFWFNVVP